MGQQLAEGDALLRVVWADDLQFGRQVDVNIIIEIQQAILPELHDGRGRDRL